MMYYTNRKFKWAQEAAEILEITTIGGFVGTRTVQEIPGQPLQRLIVFSTTELPPKRDHAAIRAILKRLCKEGKCLPGKITFSNREVKMLVYLKGRNVPALFQDES